MSWYHERQVTAERYAPVAHGAYKRLVTKLVCVVICHTAQRTGYIIQVRLAVNQVPDSMVKIESRGVYNAQSYHSLHRTHAGCCWRGGPRTEARLRMCHEESAGLHSARVRYSQLLHKSRSQGKPIQLPNRGLQGGSIPKLL